LAHFNGDRDAEAEHHRAELLRAKDLLAASFANISVEPYFVKFDGVWRVNEADHQQSTAATDAARKLA